MAVCTLLEDLKATRNETLAYHDLSDAEDRLLDETSGTGAAGV
jgi:hypothetical protein